MELIFEQSVPGRTGISLPAIDVPEEEIESLIPAEYLRQEPPGLPEVSEVEAARHFTRLSRRNFGVDTGFYPLGSCTMKYNPKVNEDMARLNGFARIHPYQSADTVQGCLELLYHMDRCLSELTGMARVSLQPAAGAHGELTGLMMIKAYHENRGEGHRKKIIVPDSSHGTNPASAQMAGLEIVEIKSGKNGRVDLEELRKTVDGQVAGIMLTNPNTLGIFESDIREIADIVHSAGGLLYNDGANANAILGISTPGDMGFDVVHLNLHKSFAAPHGGGGPGSGPVGVKERLTPFLPKPLVEIKEDGSYYLEYNRPLSIGKVKSYYGNFGVVVKAYAYILAMGPEGLRRVAEDAVLNANFLMKKLKEYYDLPYDQVCKHEFVLSGARQKEKGVNTEDIAKRLLDYGYHPPTVYFPLIVKEALMIEPTETENLETLERFIDAMIRIATEVEQEPEKVRLAPHTTVVGRLDAVKAARKPALIWKS
ncbi:aminomethyl-transferring glycine dehydrogenase subunit GcvPB [Pelotomaculum isophthalicicum JI]|uniref:Probable glycine dehydrogenase (decarboxylating) subunit 2 n=1 Tax=Pelotomaculum isophthalicicum JI TaxID=947010 RepID=A0A9X4GZ84_9FIRM|nr:aminomethyl-transferring glycine dehydrogenase subunit GcvPB [Pelotomaculum isophthalicicum JI]